MRILQLAPPWLSVPPSAYGGIEWVVSGLTDGLVDAGHEVTLFASGGSHTAARLETVFDEPPFEQLGDARVESIHALAAYRRRWDFDLIHDHTAAVGPALASLADGPPVVHTLHLPWQDEQIRLARLVAPPVSLVAISNDQAARAPDDVPINAPPIVSHTWSAVLMHHEYWGPTREKLSPESVVFVNTTLFDSELDRSAYRVVEVPATQIATDTATQMVGSMVMVGAYAAVTGLVSLESLLRAMEDAVPVYRKQHVETNAKALEAGFGLLEPGTQPAWAEGD